MVFKDDQEIVWQLFKDEYHNNSPIASKLTWFNFIKNKNLGIHFFKSLHDDGSSIIPATSTYIIVNEKKWLLTKLKYGI